MFELLPIGLAFALGVLAYRVGLPPLVGYLFAGFLLSNIWEGGQQTLEVFSEFGITILLFSIGLKLKLSELAKREVFGAALVHFLVSLLLFFSIFSIPYFGLDKTTSLLIAFALTFSSTVYVIKLLEERGDIRSHYGRIAIGILIIQDIIAVGFVAFSANQVPSLWALALIAGIWPIRWVLLKVFSWVGHDELMVLLGIVVALTGAFLFDQVNIKGDLGALVFGYLVASHPRASELNKSLMSLKNFFLLGFFLSIGMHGVPTFEQVGIAIAICFLLPIRSGFYFFLFNRSGLRSRTALLGASSLFNFSEFGLIVMAISASLGWLSSYWVSVLALTVAFSYLLAAILNKNIARLYRRHRSQLKDYEMMNVHPLETEINLKEANVLVFGLGRVGSEACHAFARSTRLKPIGFDYSPDVISAHQDKDFAVVLGDATSADFWSRVDFRKSQIQMVMLAMPKATQNIRAARFLRSKGYKGMVSSIAKHPDEIEKLQSAGVNRAFYLYAEAGIGFAESSKQLLQETH